MKSLLLLLLLVAIWNCDGPNPPDYDLIIKNVTLIDGTGMPARPNVNLWVNDGLISKIDSGAVKATAKAVVDGTGKYLIPGLIDAHTHPFPLSEVLPQLVHFGVTGAFITGGSYATNENLARARAMLSIDSIPAPKVYHTSQHFTMEGRHPVKTYASDRWVEGQTVYYVRDTLRIADYVAEVAQQPILGIKVTIEDGPAPPFVKRMPVEFVAKIVKEARRYDLKVFAHVSDIEEVYIAEAAGVDHIIHFIGVDIDWKRDQAMIDRLRERDVSWVTTLMIDKSFFYPAHPEWIEAVKALKIYDELEIARLRASASPEASLTFLRETYGMSNPTLSGIIAPQLQDLQRLHELGFNLVVGTDIGNDFIFPGLSMHEELELLADGFTPLELIRMATRNAAEMLDILDATGSLEVGKAADMLLLNDNPLDDIRNSRSIEAVFIDGTPQQRIN